MIAEYTCSPVSIVYTSPHECVNIYPSPMHSVCKDTLVGVCVCVLALNRLIANFN